MMGSHFLTHTHISWLSHSVCFQSLCIFLFFSHFILFCVLACSTLPDVPHAQVTQETRKSQYQAGHMIHFACEPGYTSALTIKYVCTTEGWQPLQRGSCYREFKSFLFFSHSHVNDYSSISRDH